MSASVAWSELPDGALIEPSVYAADLMHLGDQVDALMDAGVRAIHVDIGDGHFVAPVIFGEIVVEAISRRAHPRGGLVDCHMMVADPEHHVGRIAAAGADSFTFHLEASDDPDRTAAAVRASGLQVGVAASPGTTMAQLAEPAATADLALCMGVHPGLSGQSFLPDTVARVAELRERLPAGVRIQVDGGVGEDNISALHLAGAHLFVAGSSIFGHDDPTVGYRSLCSQLTAGS